MTSVTESTPSAARYIMVGGFLGAGKTTAVAKLARFLADRGKSVGLITNDQAGGLVDTLVLRQQGFATEEIAGGCFCCRFNTLVEAAGKLTATTKPDVFIAEPVGSCTDLVATVTYPLRRIYGQSFDIAPLSVLVDPLRARRLFDLDRSGAKFSHKVEYIFKKQLEEADIIVIGKSDLLKTAELEELKAALSQTYPGTHILAAAPRDGSGLDEWFEILLSNQQEKKVAMALDYDMYADGEALLGWLNATVSLSTSSSDAEFDANDFLHALATRIQQNLAALPAEVAHLKMTFAPDDPVFAGELASINLVRSDFVPELGMILDEPVTGGQIIVNLRAESPPDRLVDQLNDALAFLQGDFPQVAIQLDHEEHFRPGRPEPTHRDL